MNINTIICWFYSIPDTVYAAVIASFLTLGGVLLTNHSSHKRLITQLAIEADERSKEREINLRKEVYLKTAEGLTRAQQFLGVLSKGNFSSLDIDNYLRGFFSSASKIHIVGTDKTIKAITEVVAKFNEGMLRLVSLSLPLDNIKTDIDAYSADHEHRFCAIVNTTVAGRRRCQSFTPGVHDPSMGSWLFASIPPSG